jgi:hypothetical protein
MVGMVYTTLPFRFHLESLAEIVVQTPAIALKVALADGRVVQIAPGVDAAMSRLKLAIPQRQQRGAVRRERRGIASAPVSKKSRNIRLSPGTIL